MIALWKKSIEMSAVYCVGRLALLSGDEAGSRPFIQELSIAEAPKDVSGWREQLETVVALGKQSSPARPASEHVDVCTQAFDRCFPNFDKEIELRSQPLQSLYAFEGPGLLRLACKLACLEPPQQATIWLAQPVSAGGGIDLLPDSQGPQAIVEAVLTHVDPRLPESLRLTWLLARSAYRTPRAPGSAAPILPSNFSDANYLLAVVLRAAVELELITLDTQIVELAQRLWTPDFSDQTPASTTAIDLLKLAQDL